MLFTLQNYCPRRDCHVDKTATRLPIFPPQANPPQPAAQQHLEALHHTDVEVGASPSDVKKQLRNMTDKGYIARNAADGSWNVFAVTAL